MQNIYISVELNSFDVIVFVLLILYGMILMISLLLLVGNLNVVRMLAMCSAQAVATAVDEYNSFSFFFFSSAVETKPRWYCFFLLQYLFFFVIQLKFYLAIHSETVNER